MVIMIFLKVKGIRDHGFKYIKQKNLNPFSPPVHITFSKQEATL